MPQPCKTCGHPRLPEIHAMRDQGVPLADLATEFGLGSTALWRHFDRRHPVTGFAAVTCPSVPDPREPPISRRAVATGPRPVKPVAPKDEDRGEAPLAMAMLAQVQHAASIPVRPKSSLPADPKELSLLSALGATDQELADLLGCGESDVSGIARGSRGDDRALFNVTDQDWAKHFVRLAMSELIMLRRRRQDALDGKRWREADRMDPKIAKATESLFQTLRRFGMANPIPADDLGHGGNDRRDIMAMLRSSIEGIPPPPLTDEEERRFLEQERQYAESHRAIA